MTPPARADGRQPGSLPPNRFHAAAWIVGDRHRIAPDVWIGAFCVIDAAHDDLTIGDGSVIAAGAQVYTHSTVRRTRGDGPLEHAPTKIGSRVSVCAGAIVLMGCEIGDGAVIGAGAVVRERTVVPAGETWAGVPARPVRRGGAATAPARVPALGGARRSILGPWRDRGTIAGVILSGRASKTVFALTGQPKISRAEFAQRFVEVDVLMVKGAGRKTLREIREAVQAFAPLGQWGRRP